jgi:hypothetical protein
VQPFDGGLKDSVIIQRLFPSLAAPLGHETAFHQTYKGSIRWSPISDNSLRRLSPG